MRLLKRRTATPEPRTAAELRAEIDQLTAASRARPDRQTERRVLRLRHALGLLQLEQAGAAPDFPDPAGAEPPESAELPGVAPEDLTPELVRAGILRDGCVLVRGLVPRERAVRLAEEIDRSFAERE